MSKFKKIVQSFYAKDNLNPKVWNETKSGFVLDSKIREHLLSIADNFIEFLKVDIIVDDIILIGSLANYNWSEFSDFDLHIVADFDQFPEDKLELYQELFKLKKTL